MYLIEIGWLSLGEGQQGSCAVKGGHVGALGVFGCQHIVLVSSTLVLSTCFIKLTYNRQMIFLRKITVLG